MIVMIPKFKNNKVAVFSDLHLGIHNNSSQWHEISLSWAEWFVNNLKKQGIEDVVFCGDWHHNRSEISVDTLNISAKILSMFNDLNLYIITGNHDIYYKHRTDVHSMNVFKGRNNVHIIDEPFELKLDNRIIHFLPWGYNLDSFNSKADVCFGHLEIISFQMNTAKQCEEGFKAGELLDKYSLIMSGHFHARHERKFAEGNILYVGNPFQTDFGDVNNEKGYYILSLEDIIGYKFIPNPVSPKYNKITLSEMVAARTITDSIAKKITNNFVKLSIDKNISQDHLTVLTTKLNGLTPSSLIIDYDMTSNKMLTNTDGHDFSGIDVNQAIEEFINLLDIENKTQITQYTLELFKKCKV